jgi:3-oxoacyl-[acyl-carrier protein] reductase
MIDQNSLEHSNILITGASKGIGFSTATAALQNGAAKVVLVARASTQFNKAVEQLKSLADDEGQVIAIPADLSKSEGAAIVVQQLVEQNINIHHIVNNAGYTKPAPLHEATIADFKMTMSVNVYAPFLLIQQMMRLNFSLKTIVNIASTAGIRGRTGWLSYSASKAALIAVSETLREELRPYGVNVVCLSPGRCATDLRKTLAPDEDPTTIMQPSQVADIIMLSLSELGRLIDSENIVVRT